MDVKALLNKHFNRENSIKIQEDIDSKLNLITSMNYDRKTFYEVYNRLFHLFEDLRRKGIKSKEFTRKLLGLAEKFVSVHCYRTDDILAFSEVLQIFNRRERLIAFLRQRILIADPDDVLKLYLINYLIKSGELSEARNFLLDNIHKAETPHLYLELFKKEVYYMIKLDSFEDSKVEKLRDYLIETYPLKRDNISKGYDMFQTDHSRAYLIK